MRSLPSLLFAALFTMISPAFGSDQVTVEKVKTGILPTGELYGLYEVQCANQSQGSIVSLRGRSQWCTHQNDELQCFRKMEQASQLACADQRLLANNDLEPGSEPGTLLPR
jgi:hypothetical protein